MSEIQYFTIKEPFVFESGESLPKLTIAYHTFGTLNTKKDNVIWVFHALTASSNVLDWWKGLFGKDCFFDPKEYFIVCANVLGSPYGSTMPEDLSFPQFSIRDVVRTHLLLAQHLSIKKIYTAIGGSMGGNQALEFAYVFPGEIQNLILVASCSKESAWGIAVHESQRVALKTDPTFGKDKNGGNLGMKAARSMAMLTYRTADAFIETQTDATEKTDDFRASSYIQYQGDKFVKRFNALSYYYLTKCLDSHNIGRNRGGEPVALERIKIPTLVIGIDSDVLIPIRFQKFMANHLANATYHEIHSEYGHDGFLVETEKLTAIFQEYFQKRENKKSINARTVLKFGGSSLKKGAAISAVINTIEKEYTAKTPLAVVISARADSTNRLISLYNNALQGNFNQKDFNDFFDLQYDDKVTLDLSSFRNKLENLLHAVALLQVDTVKTRDRILSIGEKISAKLITELLIAKGVNALYTDASELIKVTKEDTTKSSPEVAIALSRKHTKDYFKKLSNDQVPVITGFFGSDTHGNVVTLGRNAGNYSATLIASFINAKEVQNWTTTDGLYSADPKYVENPKKISHLSFKEANELVNTGTHILHPKTILPLVEYSIPLKIFNSLSPDNTGTLIDKQGSQKGIKAVSAIESVSLVTLEGGGLLDKVGIDARIFNALSAKNISVRLISQASSERGIGFVVDQKEAQKTEWVLNKEFENELKGQDVSNIQVRTDMSIVAILGDYEYALEKVIRALRKNKITVHLISNSINREHLSLVIDTKNLKKAINVVHNHIFGITKTLHLFAFGKGRVGKKLIDQIIATPKAVSVKRNLAIKIIGVADSKKILFKPEQGLDQNWLTELSESSDKNNITTLIDEIKNSGLENIVIADNTASQSLSKKYPQFVNAGFDIVASNKKANSAKYAYYKELRETLKKNSKLFYYETNVGAALPVIDTIKHLYKSNDRITCIRGVFSGSLSYLFNTYCSKNQTDSFSEILKKAQNLGYTEPDPREDLSGMDVVRKLIILAREIGVEVELEDVKLQNLIPDTLQNITDLDTFWLQKSVLDTHYQHLKERLKPNEVLRYIGEFNADSNTLEVKLITVDNASPLGNLKNADAIFEIFTEEYGQHPVTIMGAGAGAEVTARGLYSDLLKIGARQ